MNRPSVRTDEVTGEFLTLAGERAPTRIRNVDEMAPFFVSLVSNSDHWLFISSTGGLTAGRGVPRHSAIPVHYSRQDSRKHSAYLQQDARPRG